MNKLKVILGVIAVIAVIIAGGYFMINQQQSSALAKQKAYATAYEAHALGEPFNLLSKEWSNHQWTYIYQSPSTIELSYDQAKSQLTGGGYQVVASKPDTKDTIYRDLITGDVSVTAKIARTAAGGAGITVIVTGIEK